MKALAEAPSEVSFGFSWDSTCAHVCSPTGVGIEEADG